MKFVLTTLMLVAIVGWSSGDKSDVDVNAELVKAIEESMRVKADPCLEFHYYACGEWSDPDEYSTRYKVKSDITNELIQFMDESDMTDMPEFVKKSYVFYSSCIDTEKIHELNYIRWLEEHENMKSVLLSPSEDTDAKFDWVRTLGIMRRYGMNNIFIKEDFKAMNSDSSKKLNALRNAKGQEFDRMSEYMYDVLSDSIKLPSDQTINELRKEISAFEDLLQKLYDLEDESGEQLITVKELPLPWLNKYLGIILQQSTLDSNMELTIQNVEYMEALDALLKEYDDKFICRYLEVRFLWFIYAEILPQSHSNCMVATSRVFPLAMHWIYEHLYPEVMQYVPKIEHMFGNIIDHINQTLRSDKAGLVSEKIFEKLDNIQIKVGNLPRVDTIQVLNSHYDRLKLDKSDLYGNHLSLLEFYFYLDHMSTANDRNINANKYFNAMEDYSDALTDRTSFNISSENIVIIPAELLRPPFYNLAYYDIFNYGSIGTVLAHSIYYNLEFDGLDESEKAKLVDIISLRTTTDIVFSQFPAELNEKHYTINGEQMSMKKLFFLNAAQFFCTKYMDSDINESFERTPEFAEIFECKFNSYLQLFGI